MVSSTFINQRISNRNFKRVLVLIQVFSTPYSTKSYFLTFSTLYVNLKVSVELKIGALLSWRMEYFQSLALILSGFGRSANLLSFFWKDVVVHCVILTVCIRSYSVQMRENAYQNICKEGRKEGRKQASKQVSKIFIFSWLKE